MSSELKSDVSKIVSKIEARAKERHEGTVVKYTNCVMNGCWDGCQLACSVKDGKIVSIDVGDPVNVNNPREDIGIENVKQGMVQHRPCVRGRMWRKTIEENRLLHPVKNVGEKGNPVWEVISWEEALDTIAEKMKFCIEKYGVTSIRTGFFSELGMYAGFGTFPWGLCSYAGTELPEQMMYGFNDMAPFANPDYENCTGTEPPDLLNAKAIIGIGWNPAVTHPAYVNYLSLAKEQGIPVIMVDPRYTPTVAAYADQWIPIRPDTDTALMLAMANVIIREDLIDHGFVDKFVEPEGLKKWIAYVLGETDNIDKSPEWAEPICAVPAETIRELARFYGGFHGYSDGNACYLKAHWVIARTPQGENAAWLSMYLPALTGNVGVPGGMFGGGDAFVPAMFPMPRFYRGQAMPSYIPPTTHNVRTWVDAVLYRDDYESGRMSEEEYRRRIGCAKDWEIPNIHMSFELQGGLLGGHDSNRFREAFKKLDFVVQPAQTLDYPYAAYSDIVLPLADKVFEAPEDFSGGFVVPCENCVTPLGNYFLLRQKVVDAPGEAKSQLWIDTQLAKRLGVLDTFNPAMADVLDDQQAWDERIVELQRQSYEAWRPLYAAWAEQEGIEPAQAPTWEEFNENPIFRVPLTREPHYAFKANIQDGKPFDTASGKIEFFSEAIADSSIVDNAIIYDQHSVFNKYCFGGEYPTQVAPMGQYQQPWDSPLGEIAEKYPLRIMTPHSFFRIHYAEDNNAWIPDEARHAFWISVADAAARGISDGDIVRVYNENGEVVIPAYVTSKVAPGTSNIVYGAMYKAGERKSESAPHGVDIRGAGNEHTSGRQYPWVVGNLHCASQVQVELWRD